jgi:hypothetical protein
MLLLPANDCVRYVRMCTCSAARAASYSLCVAAGVVAQHGSSPSTCWACRLASTSARATSYCPCTLARACRASVAQCPHDPEGPSLCRGCGRRAAPESHSPFNSVRQRSYWGGLPARVRGWSSTGHKRCSSRTASRLLLVATTSKSQGHGPGWADSERSTIPSPTSHGQNLEGRHDDPGSWAVCILRLELLANQLASSSARADIRPATGGALTPLAVLSLAGRWQRRRNPRRAPVHASEQAPPSPIRCPESPCDNARREPELPVLDAGAAMELHHGRRPWHTAPTGPSTPTRKSPVPSPPIPDLAGKRGGNFRFPTRPGTGIGKSPVFPIRPSPLGGSLSIPRLPGSPLTCATGRPSSTPPLR